MHLLELLKATSLVALNRKLHRAEFERRRLARFRRFAAFVMRNSPFYARIMREHHIDPASCSVEQFPVLTKSDVMENFDEIVTARDVSRAGVAEFLHTSHDSADRYLGRYHVIHTSGSSGQVGYFVYDENRGRAGSRR